MALPICDHPTSLPPLSTQGPRLPVYTVNSREEWPRPSCTLRFCYFWGSSPRLNYSTTSTIIVATTITVAITTAQRHHHATTFTSTFSEGKERRVEEAKVEPRQELENVGLITGPLF
ncbi:hypothetical protein HYC85_026497 [Camellia sinensis]|uniref:Uncharacterized protein n=1 Tax=Camellia sinensis TaxID=4442 RepID=A0A7J7G7F7_CAMSI|nr:hypothetical protein HYC85_026497 [Camellia sinensis]